MSLRFAHVLAAFAAMTSATIVLAAGDPQRGAQVFRACAACHAFEPGRHLTGPSLAGLFGRKAASLENYRRYSEELKRSGVEWNERTLDGWVRDPQKLGTGSQLQFHGAAGD